MSCFGVFSAFTSNVTFEAFADNRDKQKIDSVTFIGYYETHMRVQTF